MSGNNDDNNMVGTVDQMNVQSVQAEARSTAEQAPSVMPAKARLAVRRTAGRPQFSKALNTSKRHKTLGTVLRARRLDLRLTQRELAVQLNVKPRTSPIWNSIGVVRP